jgi:hypothetical protein
VDINIIPARSGDPATSLPLKDGEVDIKREKYTNKIEVEVNDESELYVKVWGEDSCTSNRWVSGV